MSRLQEKGQTVAKHAINPALARLSLLDGADIALNALNGAAHYLGGIKEILTVAEKKWSEEGNFETSKLLNNLETNRLIWHTRSCVWELFAVSDMMLQWANTRFGLGLKENQVRWDDLKIRKAQIDAPLWATVRKTIENERESESYFEISTYRHFSHISVLHFQSIVSRDKGLIMMSLEPARVGASPRDVREQLAGYIEFMQAFGVKVFLAK